MDIQKTVNGNAAVFALTGRLDTTTAPQLEAELKEAMDSIDQLTMDFSKLDYISSAGLRVILATQKVMGKKGGMKLCHVCPEIMEVFEITGFSDILTIE